MSVMLVEKPLHLKVDQQRLLRELPAFFGSFRDCLTELVQNAHRAGATEVTIVLNKDDRTLLFEDNGRGSADPESFTTAGRTGWDESVVTDPAGLGFFSLLGLAEQVVVQSRAEGHCGWQMVVTPENFNGVEVPWDPLSESFGPQPTGTRLEVKLGSKADLNVVNDYGCSYQQFRCLFPLEVNMTIIEHGLSRQPKNLKQVSLENLPFLDTPVGQVVRAYATERTGFYNGLHVVWEHRVLDASATWTKLEEELKNLPDGKWVVKACKDIPLFWLVDPASGVRPKLPDRRGVIADEHYLSAIRTLALALHQAFNPKRVIEVVAALGIDDDLSNGTHHAHAQMREPLRAIIPSIFQPKGDHILRLCGWQKCPYKDYSEGCIDEEEGVYKPRIPERYHLIRNPLQVRSAEMAQALNAARCWAIKTSDPQDVEVQVTGVKIAGITGFNFGICDRIAVMVDGELHQELERLDLSRWVEQDVLDMTTDAELEGGCYLLKDAEPMELFETMNQFNSGNNRELQYFVYDCLAEWGELESYIYDEHEGAIDDERIENDLIAAWTTVFKPEIAGAQDRYTSLVQLQRELERATSGFSSLIRQVDGYITQYPEVAAAVALLANLRACHNVGFSAYTWDPSDSHYQGTPVTGSAGVES